MFPFPIVEKSEVEKFNRDCKSLARLGILKNRLKQYVRIVKKELDKDKVHNIVHNNVEYRIRHASNEKNIIVNSNGEEIKKIRKVHQDSGLTLCPVFDATEEQGITKANGQEMLPLIPKGFDSGVRQ